jgi:lycopene cyclase domain-containing protein
MPEYTTLALASVVVVLALERFALRTGVLRSRSFWVAMGICLLFMILVNGWLTKLSDPIVLYSADQKTPWRFPLDIPVEDYAFGFSLLALTCMLWVRNGRRSAPAPGRDR